MNSSANYFKLGLFVIVAISLLCAGVIVLGASKLFEKTVLVETYMEESIEGVGPGSAVKYRGITLGEVSQVLIAARKYQPDAIREGIFGSSVLVELAIDEARLPPGSSDEELADWLHAAAKVGLRARTASAGLTGPAFVELVYLDPELFPAPELAWTPPDLYVPSAPSTIQVFVTSVENILREFQRIDLSGLVDDADDLFVSLEQKVDDIDAKTISDNAVAFLEEIRTSNSRLEEILNNPNIDPSLEDLRATLENAKEASARLDEILDDPRLDEILTDLDAAGDDLPPALQDFRRAIRRIDRLVDSQQDAIEQLIAELNQTLENVNALTEDASENPSRLLFGDPPPKTTPGGNQ